MILNKFISKIQIQRSYQPVPCFSSMIYLSYSKIDFILSSRSHNCSDKSKNSDTILQQREIFFPLYILPTKTRKQYTNLILAGIKIDSHLFAVVEIFNGRGFSTTVSKRKCNWPPRLRWLVWFTVPTTDLVQCLRSTGLFMLEEFSESYHWPYLSLLICKTVPIGVDKTDSQ